MFLYLDSKAKLMIITISGKPGSGKSSVAKLIAKKLKLKHYSIGDFMREIAEKKGISLLELGKIAEKERWVDEELDKRQIELGKSEDNFVIDSRLGFHFIPNSVKVFLEVDLKTAAERIFNCRRKEEKENLTLNKTMENVKRRIKSERLRYKKYYSLDCYDKKQYDIIVGTTGMPAEKVSEEVIKRINQP
ncbi:cytidylate kinase [Candidatus Woesearchaeota archaeon]|jgi:cytidylate kinase|nr:cytidylate kinase [Candidatus Woesearchaeota archaeon]|tara:strand:- start:1040 stop:1609 length:570 start_codon:yes stop_codon:yes gene_type:complete